MESWNLKALWLDLIVTITVSGNCFQNSIMHLKSEQNTVNLAHLLLGDNLISHSSKLKLQSCQCPPWMYWCISLYNCTQLAFVGLISRASGSVIKSISTLMNGRSSGRAGGVLRYSAEKYEYWETMNHKMDLSTSYPPIQKYSLHGRLSIWNPGGM